MRTSTNRIPIALLLIGLCGIPSVLQAEPGRLPESGTVTLRGSADEHSAVIELGLNVAGIVAAGVEDLSAKDEPVLATVAAGDKGEESIHSWNGDRKSRAAVRLSLGTLRDGQFKVRVPGDLRGPRRLRLTLLTDDGRQLPIELTTDLSASTTVSVQFGPGDCYDVTLQCTAQGICPACSETINCCNFPPRPCGVCPGCYLSCSCDEPPPPNC